MSAAARILRLAVLLPLATVGLGVALSVLFFVGAIAAEAMGAPEIVQLGAGLLITVSGMGAGIGALQAWEDR